MSGDKSEQKDSKTNKSKKDWFAIVTTTVVGALITLGVAWYQMNSSQEQAVLAEKERAKAVKSELVQIVEDHVVNGKQFDISRLSRLLDYRAREENLSVTPLASDIVRGAEFNIFKSRYLDFEKKEEYKEVFDKIYQDLSLRSDFFYKGINENTVNELYLSIQRNDTTSSLDILSQLLISFNEEVNKLKAKKSIQVKDLVSEVISLFYEKPLLLIGLILSYLLLITASLRLMKSVRVNIKEKRDDVAWKRLMTERMELDEFFDKKRDS